MRPVHRLVAWQRIVLFASGVVLLASGAAWLGLHHGRGADALPSPLEPWTMRVHGLAAFVALFALGALAAAHVPQGWRLSQRMRWAHQRGSGIALCVLAATLALTGYLLYYFAPDPIRPALGWLHSGLGAAMAVLVAVHRRRRAGPRPLAPGRDGPHAACPGASQRRPEGIQMRDNLIRMCVVRTLYPRP